MAKKTFVSDADIGSHSRLVTPKFTSSYTSNVGTEDADISSQKPFEDVSDEMENMGDPELERQLIEEEKFQPKEELIKEKDDKSFFEKFADIMPTKEDGRKLGKSAYEGIKSAGQFIATEVKHLPQHEREFEKYMEKRRGRKLKRIQEKNIRLQTEIDRDKLKEQRMVLGYQREVEKLQLKATKEEIKQKIRQLKRKVK